MEEYCSNDICNNVIICDGYTDEDDCKFCCEECYDEQKYKIVCGICYNKHHEEEFICCSKCEENFEFSCISCTEPRGLLKKCKDSEDYLCKKCDE